MVLCILILKRYTANTVCLHNQHCNSQFTSITATVQELENQGSHLTPNQQSQTPIFGVGLQLFRIIEQNYIVGFPLFSKRVLGTPVLKILVTALENTYYFLK